MKDIKNILFTILIFAVAGSSSSNIFGWDPVSLRAAVKDLIEGSEKLINLSGPTLEKTSEVVGQRAATALAQGMEGAARGIGVELAQAVMPYAGPAILMGTGTYSVVQLYPIAKEIYRNFRPTEEQKKSTETNINTSHKRLILLKTEEELMDCLLSSKAGDPAIPTACEQAADKLAMLGGEHEVNRMTAVYMRRRR